MDRIITGKYTELSGNTLGVMETLFHNANGYIGIRGCLEEGTPDGWETMRGSYINGFYDVIPMKQAEPLCDMVDKKDTMLNLADTMTVSCQMDGEAFAIDRGTFEEHTRSLDMDEGVTIRRAIWTSPAGSKFEIIIRRMTSFELLNLFTIEYIVRPLTGNSHIVITSSHIADVANFCKAGDPRLAAESLKNLEVIDKGLREDLSYQVSRTSTSKLDMCSIVHNDVYTSDGKKTQSYYRFGEYEAHEIFEADVKKDTCITLKKFCIYTDSIREKNVFRAAFHYMKEALGYGLDYFYAKQREYLRNFWRNSELEIFGDEASSKATAFNLYQLLQSVAKDDFCSIAAKGLSGEGYEGHYFWDTEAFILPFFILTNPALAKVLIAYRYRTLEQARENAAVMGHKKGVLYPWRTIAGKECSGYFVSGSAAYHIDADIAYGVVSYYLTTGDLAFVREMGIKILIETARLWMDLGVYDPDGRFVINVVTGPDEYTCMVNNNYYTNCAAKYNIEWAVKLYRILAAEEGQQTGGDTAGESTNRTGNGMTGKSTNRTADGTMGESTNRTVDGTMGESINRTVDGSAGESTNRTEKVSAGTLEEISKLGVTEEELLEMERAAENMLLLYDERIGINPQDDSFLSKPVWDFENTPKENYPLLLHYHPLWLYRYQVCKQADTVMAYFMFEEMQDFDVMCRSYDYYEKITTHDSSLSTCAFSIAASRLGMHDKGFMYFGDSARLDLENTHNNTTYGIHTGNMGGCYMTVVNGFAGVRCREQGLFIAPYVPGNWKGYRLNLVYRNRLLNISVDRENISIRLIEGENVEIFVYGEKQMLKTGRNLVLSTRQDAAAARF